MKAVGKFWKTKAVLIIGTLYFLFLYQDDNRIRKTEFGRYVLEYSDDRNTGIPFHFFLIDRSDGSIVSFFVNDYTVRGDYLFFTEIKGGLLADFCYADRDLLLSEIYLPAGKLNRFIDIGSHREIYNKLNAIEKKDKLWLQNEENRCPGQILEKT